MSVNLHPNVEKPEAPKRAAGRGKSAAAAVKVSVSRDEKRAKALALFTPGQRDFFAALGVNLDKIAPSDLYDLHGGKVTRNPVRMKFTPVVGGVDPKSVEPVVSYAYLQATLSRRDFNTNKYKAVEGKDIFLKVVPPRPYVLDNTFDTSVVKDADAAPRFDIFEKDAKVIEKMKAAGWPFEHLTDEMKSAMVSVGLKNMTVEDVCRICDGQSVSVDSGVNVNLGDAGIRFMPLVGEVHLEWDGSGEKFRTVFEPFAGEKKAENLLVDLDRNSYVNGYRLEFYEKEPSGDYKLDNRDCRIPTEEAKNLLRHGCSFGPVRGYARGGSKDDKKWVSKDFLVSEKGGSLFISEYKVSKDKKPELERLRMTDAGVYVGNVPSDGIVEFADAGEKDLYRQGLPAKVKDAPFYRYENKKRVSYKADGVVVAGPDGYAHLFEEKHGREIFDAIRGQKVEKKVERRKAAFSGLGL